MMTINLFLFKIVLPALISGAISFIAWRPWRHNMPITGGIWGGAYIVGHTRIFGVPPFLPVEATQWLAYLALAAMVLDLFESLWQDHIALRWGLRLLFSGAVP